MDESVEGQLAPYAPIIIPGEGVALNALSGVGRTLANPRVAGPIAAGAGMLAAMPEASTAGDSPKSQLEEQRALLVQQQQAAFKRREANADNPGKLWKQADTDYQSATSQIANVDQKLKDYADLPAGQEETANEAAALEAARKDKLARTPFREKHPDWADAAPKIGTAISFGLPFLLRGKNALGSFAPGSYAGRIRAGIGAFDEAGTAGASQDIPRAVLQNLVDENQASLSAALRARRRR